MRDNDLFQLALGITSPWFVASSGFDAEKKRLDIALDFKAGSRFDCPECKADSCPVHDTVEKASCFACGARRGTWISFSTKPF